MTVAIGCADLMRDSLGNWLALGVNTDDVFNDVDRDISIEGISEEIDGRLVVIFWNWVDNPHSMP